MTSHYFSKLLVFFSYWSHAIKKSIIFEKKQRTEYALFCSQAAFIIKIMKLWNLFLVPCACKLWYLQEWIFIKYLAILSNRIRRSEAHLQWHQRNQEQCRGLPAPPKYPETASGPDDWRSWEDTASPSPHLWKRWKNKIGKLDSAPSDNRRERMEGEREDFPRKVLDRDLGRWEAWQRKLSPRVLRLHGCEGAPRTCTLPGATRSQKCSGTGSYPRSGLPARTQPNPWRWRRDPATGLLGSNIFFMHIVDCRHTLNNICDNDSHRNCFCHVHFLSTKFIHRT